MNILSELFTGTNFLRFINSLHEGILCVDTAGEIILCNKSAEEILGQSSNQLMGSSAIDSNWQCIHEDGSDFPVESRPAFISLKTAEPQNNVVIGVHHPKGLYKWLLVNSEPVYSPESKTLSGVITSFVDITALKRKEIELSLKENYLSTLINSRSDLLFRINKNGRFIDFRTDDEKLLFLKPGDFLGRTMHEIWPQEIADFHMTYLHKALTTEEVVAYEYPMTNLKGETRFFQARVKKMNTEETVSVYKDITEQKILGDKIKTGEKLLALSQQLTQIGSWEWEIASKKVYWTDELYRLFGLVPQELQITFEDYLKYIHPDDIAAVENIVQKAFRDHKPFGFFHRIIKASGEMGILLAMGEVEEDENGQAVKMRGVAQDVTEIKKAEEKLNLLTEEIITTNKELEQFGYIVSHDLQEPLRMVGSFLKLLGKKIEGQLDETSQQYIQYAIDGAERMKIMIEDLLQYSRLDRIKEKFSATDINEALQYINELFKNEIKENRAIVTMHPMPVIEANKNLITQLFANLLSNALKFHGEKDPEIEIGFTETPVQWVFYVADNGIGIEPKDIDRIFIIFQRLHNKSKYPGTGIGLAMCKKMAEIHKGSIWVESKPAAGSTFYFSIPKHHICTKKK